MKIIPVIDLKNGSVVAARQGQRKSYQAINSRLCSSSSIKDVVNGFLSLYPFNTFYLADLNAITHSGDNNNLINKIMDQNHDVEFWVDNGAKLLSIATFTNINYRRIIGTESQNEKKINISIDNLKNTILSLDFYSDNEYAGPSELLENPDLWPQDIIIMTLERVGNNSGPDLEKLKDFCQKYPDKNIIAAGGIRDKTDLLKLKTMGINHALIASALHSGVIDANIIRDLAV